MLILGHNLSFPTESKKREVFLGQTVSQTERA